MCSYLLHMCIFFHLQYNVFTLSVFRCIKLRKKMTKTYVIKDFPINVDEHQDGMSNNVSATEHSIRDMYTSLSWLPHVYGVIMFLVQLFVCLSALAVCLSDIVSTQ